MKVHNHIRILPLMTAFLFSILGTSANADPATFYIKSGDPNVPLDIKFYSANSCYEGPTLTEPGNGAANGQPVVWFAPANGKATLNVGRNSAVSGCTGELCVEFSPAQDGREFQCFSIFGGGGVAPVAIRSKPLHIKMNYNDGAFDPQTNIYTTRKLPLNILEIVEATTISSSGNWQRVCSPTGTCTVTSMRSMYVSDTLAESMTDELEAVIATTISNTTTVGAETSTPINKVSIQNGTTLSLTASLRKAVSNTKSRSRGVEETSVEELSCEYTLPPGRFGYIYQTTVVIGGESVVHRTCDHACGNEIAPVFANGSVEHLNSCS